ncbi:MAG: alkaline phosphatase family protein [Candidatus Korarchaeota archaeon]
MGVFVLGIDGLSLECLRRLSNKGHLNSISFLAERYFKAIAKACFPPQTVPAWTSIFTGVNPGKHGVFGFFNAEGGSTRVCSSLDVKFPYIFEILSMHKRSVVVYNVPLSYPFRVLYGVGVPDWLAGNGKVLIKHEKRNLIEDIVKRRVYLNPLLRSVLGWRKFAEILEKELKIRKWVLEGLLEFHFLENYFIVLSDLDWIMHSFYHVITGKNEVPNFIKKVLDEFDSLVDSLIGRAIRRNLDIIIASDHGFKTYSKVVFVNTILRKLGLARGFTIRRVSEKAPVKKLQIHKPSRTGIIEKTLAVLFDSLQRVPLANNIHRQIYKKVISSNVRFFVDSNISLAFASLSIPAFFININSKIEAKDKYTNYVVRLLSGIRDKYNRRVFGLVAKKDQIYWGAFVNKAPDICIFGNVKAGYITSPVLMGVPAIRKITNYHDFDAVLIAKSESIPRTNHRVISIYDIAPSLYALLDIPIQKGLDGKSLVNKKESYVNYIIRWKIASKVH